MIYLDYAANTPCDQQVLNRFVQLEENNPFNINSTNLLALPTKELYNNSVEMIAKLLNVHNDELVFTSSATESNNLLIKGIAKHYKGLGKHIITSFLEHSSINGPIAFLQNEGYEVDFVNIDNNGLVDMEHLASLLRSDTLLVSLSHVDSEIGLIQQVNSIGEFIKKNSNSYFHVDGTQAIGKIPVKFDFIDSYSFAAHKFYGLNGCGMLYINKSVIIEPLHHGGISTSIYRSGTPSLGLVGSSALALEIAIRELDARFVYVKKLNEKLVEAFGKYEKVIINSTINSSPYILNISFNKIKGEMVMKELALAGICLSTKSACSAPFAPSRSVFALTGNRKISRSTLRISLSHLTKNEEIEIFLCEFDKIYNEITNDKA